MRLAGHLSEAEVPDLLQVCATDTTVRLDLDELLSADVVGIDALLRIEEQGAHILNLPEYLRFELETQARRRRGT